MLKDRQQLFVAVKLSEIRVYVVNALAQDLFELIVGLSSELAVDQLRRINDLAAFVGNIIDPLQSDERVWTNPVLS